MTIHALPADLGIRVDRELAAVHRLFRQSIPKYLRESRILNLVTAPVIYSLIVPIALLDTCFSLYQAICFPAYGIAHVRRSAYVIVDRHHLAYLNAIEKVNCAYCGYANGVFAYVREITSRTEQYWCPIRHARRIRAPHARYQRFVAYDDAAGYRSRLMSFRAQLRPAARRRSRER